MLLRGVEFLIVGISVVFVFLILMVALMMLVFFLLKKFDLYHPESESVGAEGAGREQEIAAAIAAVRALQRGR
jgi:Na+-transporting methylmalonyl-CoA/oxaloacetate decarboxylase gamma subunit